MRRVWDVELVSIGGFGLREGEVRVGEIVVRHSQFDREVKSVRTVILRGLMVPKHPIQLLLNVLYWRPKEVYSGW